MHPRPLAVLALLALAASAVACDGDDDTATTTRDVTTAPNTPARTTSDVTAAPSTPAPTTATEAAPDSWSVAAALATVPDDGSDEFQITAADLAGAAELFGVVPPAFAADADAVADWVRAMTFPGDTPERELPVWVPIAEPLLPLDHTALPEFDELVGWSILDVDSFVHYQPPPPGYLLEVTGRFADDALADLAPAADGVVTTREDEDFATDLEGRSPLDQLGRAVRLARDGNRIAVALSVATTEEWLAGDGPTLADDEALLAVAEALDAVGVLSAQMFRYDFRFGLGPGVTSAEQADRVLAAVPVDTPFDTVGIGWTVAADDTARVVAVYAAAESPDTLAEQLELAYTEGVSLATAAPVTDVLGAEAVEVTVDGDIVTVTYEPVGRFWATAVQAIFQRDVPFVYVESSGG